MQSPGFLLHGKHSSLPQCSCLQGAVFDRASFSLGPSVSTSFTLPYALLLISFSPIWIDFLSVLFGVYGRNNIVSGGTLLTFSGSSGDIFSPAPCLVLCLSLEAWILFAWSPFIRNQVNFFCQSLDLPSLSACSLWPVDGSLSICF